MHPPDVTTASFDHLWWFLCSSLGQLKDPHVSAIGQMEYNFGSTSLVVSGLSDFSVWQQQDRNLLLW
jgi:hypothetical protein